jgi:hypothetical protein
LAHPFDWGLNQEAESHLRQLMSWFLDESDSFYDMSKRIEDATGTRTFDWIDYISVPMDIADGKAVQTHGLRARGRSNTYRAEGTSLPPLIIRDGKPELALKAWNVDTFRKVWSLDGTVRGEPDSAIRAVEAIDEDELKVLAVERRGFTGYDAPEENDVEAYGDAVRRLRDRERDFGSEEKAFSDLEDILSSVASRLRAPRLADAFLRSEVDYWLSRNEAARTQAEVQAEMGLGLANIDHLTFRSSRRMFRRLMRIMGILGMEQRERFYAGDRAGWGAQIFESEESGYVVFADLDLRPDERDIDFASARLGESGKKGTVGLWVELNGESAFLAGLHHVALRFDFDLGREQLRRRETEVMDPFSDFPFLKQAFTVGETWAAEKGRIERARNDGDLSDEAADEMLSRGTVGSHLEVIERRQGFKGFNQESVSAIIRATDPRNIRSRGA